MRFVQLLLTVSAAAVAFAQSGKLEFDVVSIKKGDPLAGGSSSRVTPNGVEFRNATAGTLIRSAYRLNEYQLEGGPDWLHSARFTLEAKFGEDAPRDRVPEMLQAMLAGRFRLRAHFTTKIAPKYALVVAKNGPKLQQAPPDQPTTSSQGPRSLKATNSTMESLARMLISPVAYPVVDQTGLTGRYNFALSFAPPLGTERPDESLPTVFAALEEQLGLKLQSIKGPLEVLVIDRIELPGEN